MSRLRSPSPESLDNLRAIASWAKNHVPKSSVKVLVGTKGDLPSAISQEQIQDFAKSLDAHYFMTSSVDDIGVQAL